MPGKMVAISRSITGLVVAGMLASIAFPANAAQPPFPNKRVTIAASGRPLPDVLKELYGQAGLNVSISSAVSGGTNGTWTATPAEIWRQLSRSNNLIAYYDGSLVRVYSGTEITSRTYNAADPKAVEAQAARLGLTGGGNSVKAGKNVVIASGVPAFLNRISDLASRASAPVAPPPAVIASTPSPVVPTAVSKAPMASDIVSPLNKGPVSGGVNVAAVPPAATTAALPYQLDYTVMNRASRADPYEIRVYNLKYAKAEDKLINTGDGARVFRGVASVLRDQVGLGMRSPDEIVERDTANGVQRVDGVGGSYPPPPYGYYPGGPPAEAQPKQESRIIEGPRITVYNAGNSVYVRDLPGRMSMYDALVTSLDRPVTQVDVQVTIIDVDITRSSKLGIDWRAAFNAFGGGISINTGQTGQANIGGQFNNQEFATNTGFLNAQISALSQKGVLKIVTRTNISTPENLPGTTDSRQIVPLKIEGGQFQGATVVNYRVGIFLNVTPSVSKERSGLITQMEIDVRDGSIGGYLPDGTPTFKNNQMTTSASVRQGESYIIGGFRAEMTYEGTSKIPGLGDIPIAGNLFKKKSKSNSVQERVVILTPRILSDAPASLANSAAEEADDEDDKESEELANRKKLKKSPPKKKEKRTTT